MQLLPVACGGPPPAPPCVEVAGGARPPGDASRILEGMLIGLCDRAMAGDGRRGRRGLLRPNRGLQIVILASYPLRY